MSEPKYVTADAVDLARRLHVAPPSSAAGALDMLGEALAISDSAKPFQRVPPLEIARMIAETLDRDEPGAYAEIIGKIDARLELAKRSRRSFQVAQKLFG